MITEEQRKAVWEFADADQNHREVQRAVEHAERSLAHQREHLAQLEHARNKAAEAMRAALAST